MIDNELDNLSKEVFPKRDVSFEAKYWDQMNSLIDSREKKKGIIFWWAGGIATLLIAGSLWVLGLNNTSAESIKKETEGANTTISVTNNGIDKSGQENDNFKVTKSPEINRTAVHQNARSKRMDYNNRADVVPAANVPKANNDASASIKSSEVLPQQFENGGNKNALPPTTESKNVSLQSPPSENEINSTTSISSLPSIAKSLSATYDAQTSKTTLDALEKKSANIRNYFILPELYIMPIDSIGLENETEFGEKVASNKALKFFIEPIIGYHSNLSAVRVSTTVGQSESDVYFNPTKDFQVGVNSGLKVKGFVASIGLQYNQLMGTINNTERYLEQSTNQSVNSQIQIGSIDSTLIKTPVIRVPNGNDIVFQSGAPQYEVDTNFITVYDTTEVTNDIQKSRNESSNFKLQYIYLPIYIGYEYPIKKCFIAAGLGLDLGVLVKESGKSFNSETNRLEELTTSGVANSTTLSFNLQTAFGYYLKPNLSLAIKPNFRQQVISPMKGFEGKKTRIGGLLGLRYEF